MISLNLKDSASEPGLGSSLQLLGSKLSYFGYDTLDLHMMNTTMNRQERSPFWVMLRISMIPHKHPRGDVQIIR